MLSTAVALECALRRSLTAIRLSAPVICFCVEIVRTHHSGVVTHFGCVADKSNKEFCPTAHGNASVYGPNSMQFECII